MKINLQSPELINDKDIKLAARYWTQNGEFRDYKKSTKYDVLIDGKRYPPKAICGIAFENATGRVLSSMDFHGAKDGPWHTRLRALGFKIVLKNLVHQKAQQEKKLVNQSAVRVMLKTLREADGLIVLTSNKHTHASGNFEKLRGNNGYWSDGDWTITPKVKPEWGAHFQSPLAPGGNSKVWYGQWVESRKVSADKNATGRFKFIYRNVIGPISTQATFKEIFSPTVV
jgi:hypothetical protein